MVLASAASLELALYETIAFSGDFPGNFDSPKMGAYHPGLRKILVTLSPYFGDQNAYIQYIDAVCSATAVGVTSGTRERWSTFRPNRNVEASLVVVPPNGPPVAAGFSPGDVFVSKDTTGAITRLSSTGAVISDPWSTPPAPAGLWGGLAFDTAGSFGGKLIAVATQGDIFSIDHNGSHSLLKHTTKRWEGVAVAPSTFGPHGGHLIVGVEGYSESDTESGKLYALAPDGTLIVIATIGWIIDALAFVPAEGGTFYQCQLSFKHQRDNRLWSATSSQFLARRGELIVSNELSGEIWAVKWDGAQYVPAIIGRVPGRWTSSGFNEQGTELEGACFAHLAPTAPQWTDWAVIANGGTTDVAPAAFAHSVGGTPPVFNLHLFTKGIVDRAVYVNTRSSGTWSGVSEVSPGGLTTSHSIAAVEYNGQGYVFVVRDDNTIAFKMLYDVGSDAQTTGAWLTVPGGGHTDAAVAAAVFQGDLVLCGKGVIDKRLYVNRLRYGGRTWTGWSVVPGGLRTDAAPALVVFQDELYVFTKQLGADGVQVQAATPEYAWTAPVQPPGTPTTTVAPAAATLATQLYLLAPDPSTRNAVAIVSETGTWGPWLPLPHAGTTDVSIAATTFGDDQLYLIAKAWQTASSTTATLRNSRVSSCAVGQEPPHTVDDCCPAGGRVFDVTVDVERKSD
jgi:hypothetical protein